MNEEQHAELYTQLFALAQTLEKLDAEFASLKVSFEVEVSFAFVDGNHRPHGRARSAPGTQQSMRALRPHDANVVM